jgi:hypothetical protein
MPVPTPPETFEPRLFQVTTGADTEDTVGTFRWALALAAALPGAPTVEIASKYVVLWLLLCACSSVRARGCRCECLKTMFALIRPWPASRSYCSRETLRSSVGISRFSRI